MSLLLTLLACLITSSFVGIRRKISAADSPAYTGESAFIILFEIIISNQSIQSMEKGEA